MDTDEKGKQWRTSKEDCFKWKRSLFVSLEEIWTTEIVGKKNKKGGTTLDDGGDGLSLIAWKRIISA